MSNVISQLPFLSFSLQKVTEAAALAASDFIGRGDARKINQASVTAMRKAFESVPIKGNIVIGDGSDTDTRAAFTPQEIVGNPTSSLEYDIAIDPVEGTSYLTKGMTNAMSVLAMAPKGAMYSPGPAFYMEKIAGPPALKGKIDPNAPINEKLNIIAKCSGKSVKDLIIYVMEKTRHRALIDSIHQAGARIALYPAGDIAGAIMAATPNSSIDAMFGTGGSPEGIISACAIRAMGGEFMARLDPQLPSEHIAVREAGLSTEKWLMRDELITSDDVYFAGTGITTGLLFDGIERTEFHECTQSLLISGASQDRHILTTYHSPRPLENEEGQGERCL